MEKIQQITTLEELIQSEGVPTGNVIVDAFVEWVKANRSNQVTDAAEALGIPQRLLSDTIKFFVGTTAQNFILRWRMKQLLTLLDDPDITNEDAARRCHFTSVTYVEILMKKYYQTTLRAYRTGQARRDYYLTAEERRTRNDNAKKLHDK